MNDLPVPENAQELAKRLSTPVVLGSAETRYAPPLSSQLELPNTASGVVGGGAVRLPNTASGDLGGDVVLCFADFEDQDKFDAKGLGPEGAQIFTLFNGQQVFHDRALLRRVLLSGQESGRVSQLADNFGVTVKQFDRGSAGRSKRVRVRPPVAEVRAVLAAAFQQFPRLGHFDDDAQTTFTLRTWTESDRGHALFHNDLMRCCLLSLSEVSAKRASFIDSRPPKRGRGEETRQGGRLPPAAPVAGHGHGEISTGELAGTPADLGASRGSIPGLGRHEAPEENRSASSGPGLRPIVPYPLTQPSLMSPTTPPDGRD